MCLFLLSLDNLLLKDVMDFIFGKHILKWRSFEKKRLFLKNLLFAFLVKREKTRTFPQHISHSHNTRILLTLLKCFAYTNFATKKKYKLFKHGFSLVRLLVLILIRAILEQSIINKMVTKIYVGMSTTNIYLKNTKFIVIGKKPDFEWW